MAGLFDERNGGLVTHWKSKAAITALVGTGDSCRIWPDLAPQKADVPYAIFTRVGGESDQRLAGVSGSRHTVLHVYCFAATASGSDALAEAIRVNTANFKGTMSGVVVMWIACTDAPDNGADGDESGGNAHRYWTRLILRISHVEALGL